ncbi:MULTISPECIES: helix-turn-helix transcriptional regulator [Cryobacterium]|uniref:XRE family transcriptional regulator n=1 Tax=Cryobacterium breve TaxID=1259258 RepID=A0ABY2J636_9MICO|nr:MULTISPECIES: helix-turn-helix transcriptional regulator [Cryobacterium]TFC92024.1 XRE family transcriptional regulator [Cryobacterium sp. TmT3-12]TFC99837.1 XRE family transcriptional regulator [Cryobacterium breve]
MPSGGTTQPGPLSVAVAEILRREFNRSDFVSQKALGAAVGISQSQMSKHLRGERVLDVDQLDALCDALNLQIVDVVRSAQAAARRRRR